MKQAQNVLHPVHSSVIRRGRITPNRMDRVTMDPGMRDAMTRISLDIFTDMSNANQSFQEALLAIYLSGLQHGQAITSEGIAA